MIIKNVKDAIIKESYDSIATIEQLMGFLKDSLASKDEQEAMSATLLVRVILNYILDKASIDAVNCVHREVKEILDAINNKDQKPMH